MSLLKHLLISIAITIFIAWRFPETNLQIAIQNGSTSLINLIIKYSRNNSSCHRVRWYRIRNVFH